MIDSDDVLTKIRQAFVESFEVDPQLVTMETSASDIPGWDSVGHLTLASNLEQIFEISMDVDVLIEMDNVRAIERIVSAKLEKNHVK